MWNTILKLIYSHIKPSKLKVVLAEVYVDGYKNLETQFGLLICVLFICLQYKWQNSVIDVSLIEYSQRINWTSLESLKSIFSLFYGILSI